MKSRIYKSILSIALAANILATLAGFSLAVGGSVPAGSAVSTIGSAGIKGKNEVVYATLASEGSVRSMYAVNHFTIAEAGSVSDFGDYTSVENLTDTMPIEQSGDTVTVQTNAGNFYYQGNMAKTELPWLFDIGYSLDGVQTAPQELAGKSGKLDIHITSKQNTAVEPVFYDNYMLQISITLDTEKCSDISATGAIVASAGKNSLIAYTVMPGKDADISLSAVVKDFTMTGIDISAMPFSTNIEMPDTAGMIDDFTDLSDAIAELNDGVGELSDGADELKSGADKLRSGSSDIGDGLSQLSGNSGQLIQASSQISSALSQIASALGGAPGQIDLSALTQLPQGLSQLSDGLDGISGGLVALKDGFTPAYAALDAAILGIPDAAITPEQIAELYGATDLAQYGTVDQLVASYTAGQTVKGTYNSVKGAFDAVGSTIDTLSASINTISGTLDTMSGQIGGALSGLDMLGQLSQLSSGLSELNRNYATFHNGLKDYMNGVGALSYGYADFHNGLSSFRNGVGELSEGVSELHDGTTELRNETAEMPDTIQTEIDDMLDQYTGSNFEPVSFTSPKNEHTVLVQFVLKCDGIEKPEEAKVVETVTSEETFWDKLTSLFKGKEAA